MTVVESRLYSTLANESAELLAKFQLYHSFFANQFLRLIFS